MLQADNRILTILFSGENENPWFPIFDFKKSRRATGDDLFEKDSEPKAHALALFTASTPVPSHPVQCPWVIALYDFCFF